MPNKLPLEISLLLGQGDSMMNLLSNLMYRYLALVLASLGIIFGLNKLDNLLVILYVAFIIALFVIRLPLAILAEVYAYNKLRYRLVIKYLNGEDITEEKMLIKTQIEKELKKVSASTFNFDSLYVYLFLIFGGAIVLLTVLTIIDWVSAVSYAVLLFASFILIQIATQPSFDFLKKVENE